MAEDTRWIGASDHDFAKRVGPASRRHDGAVEDAVFIGLQGGDNRRDGSVLRKAKLFDDDDCLAAMPLAVAAFQRKICQTADIEFVKWPSHNLYPSQREQRSDKTDNQKGQ